MTILSYGIPAAVVGEAAARYGFTLVSTLADDRGPASGWVAIAPAASHEELWPTLDAMLARGERIAAVILRDAPGCDVCTALRCCSPQGSLYTLACDADREAMACELDRIVGSLLGRICAHEGLQASTNL